MNLNEEYRIRTVIVVERCRREEEYYHHQEIEVLLHFMITLITILEMRLLDSDGDGV